jgi:hypothetical protein
MSSIGYQNHQVQFIRLSIRLAHPVHCARGTDMIDCQIVTRFVTATDCAWQLYASVTPKWLEGGKGVLVVEVLCPILCSDGDLIWQAGRLQHFLCAWKVGFTLQPIDTHYMTLSFFCCAISVLEKERHNSVFSQRGSTEQMSWNVNTLMQTMFDEHN